MATNFPASLDTLTNPTSSDSLSSPSHSAQHANVNDAVEALQAKVGADSSGVTSSHDYKIAQLEAISHGKILQVVSTTKTDTYTNATGSFADVTGLSVSITPSAATSKVLVIVSLSISSNSGIIHAAKLLRDSTDIFIADAASNRTRSSTASRSAGGLETFSHSLVHLDSPATTSATTYKIQVIGFTDTVHVNKSDLDSDLTIVPRMASSITVMEVSA
jgi:hypothetical protein